jgi:heavy metal sensor kinase
MFDSVRIRLTLWYACVLALSLIVFAFLLYKATSTVFYERQDESLRSTAKTVASAYQEEFEEQRSIERAGQVVLAELTFPDRYVLLLDNDGHVMASSRNASNIVLTISPTILKEVHDQSFSVTTVGNLRVAILPLSGEKPIGFATVAEPVSVIDDGLRQLRRDFFAGVLVVLLLASCGGYFLARKSLVPVAIMNRQTQRISFQNLSSRLDITNPRDELGSLATTINELLDRLEHSFEEQQRFIADASHELRTPIAVLRVESEVSLTKRRTVAEYQQSLAVINAEAERLSRIVEDLFVLARQPVPATPTLVKQSLSLNDVVGDCARAARVLATRKGVQLTMETVSEPVILRGDEDLLKRMVLNLLDNAIKFTSSGGQVLITLARQNGNAEITVADTGIGIPEVAQPYVFDRFYRVDKARSRRSGGAGLGLSIVSWIVSVHEGNITMESHPGEGTKFIVRLPASPQEKSTLSAPAKDKSLSLIDA